MTGSFEMLTSPNQRGQQFRPNLEHIGETSRQLDGEEYARTTMVIASYLYIVLQQPRSGSSGL